MNGYQKQKPDLQWKNVKTIYEYKPPNGSGYWLRVGHWIKDGREGELVFEKRNFYEGVSGFVKTQEQKGLNKQALYHLFNNAGTIQDLFDFPMPKEFAADIAENNKHTQEELWGNI